MHSFDSLCAMEPVGEIEAKAAKETQGYCDEITKAIKMLKRQRILKVILADYSEAGVPSPGWLVDLWGHDNRKCEMLSKRKWETLMQEARKGLREGQHLEPQESQGCLEI